MLVMPPCGLVLGACPMSIAYISISPDLGLLVDVIPIEYQ